MLSRDQSCAFKTRRMIAWQFVISLLRCRHSIRFQPQLEKLFMTRRIICFLIAAAGVIGAVPLFAQEGAAAAAGTLTLDKKTYTLKRALAYETTIDDEDAIAVVFERSAGDGRDVEQSQRRGEGGWGSRVQAAVSPARVQEDGEFKNWSAAAGGTTLGRRSGEATGELKALDGRVRGKAGQPTETEGMFPSGFDASFDVALLKAGQSVPASTARKGGPAANVKPTVSGVFRGNGKEANLASVSARWVEPFSDQTGIELVFTEKDHSKEKKPDMGAMFGKFGSALIISLHEDGQIYSCQVVHRAHQKQGFSSIGNLEATEFTYEDGKVEGELTTSGQVETFGETWEVKIKFVAPLGETPKEFQVAEAKKPESARNQRLG